MGTIIRIKCNNCEKEEEHGLGTGFSYYTENVFIKNYDESEKPIIYKIISDINVLNNIQNKLENGAVPGEEYGFDLYYCKSCKVIDDYFYFSLLKNEELYIPNYECNICKVKMDRILDFNNYLGFKFENNPSEYIKLIEIRCKICGSNKVIIEECGNWD